MGILEAMKDELEKDGFLDLVDRILDMRAAMGHEKFARHLSMLDAIQEGRDEGKVEGKMEITRNLLSETSLSIEKIAELVGASTEFVLSVKQGKYKDLSLE